MNDQIESVAAKSSAVLFYAEVKQAIENKVSYCIPH